VSQLFGSSVEKVSERNFENFETFFRQFFFSEKNGIEMPT